jgi:hypothetical protein
VGFSPFEILQNVLNRADYGNCQDSKDGQLDYPFDYIHHATPFLTDRLRQFHHDPEIPLGFLE